MNRIHAQPCHLTDRYLADIGPIPDDVPPVEIPQEPKSLVIMGLEMEIETLKTQVEILRKQIELSQREEARLRQLLNNTDPGMPWAYE